MSLNRLWSRVSPRERLVWAAGLSVAVALIGGTAYAVGSSSGHGATIDCPAGDGLLAKPGGDHVTGECVTLPTTSPTGSPSPTTSPSPSPSTTSPSPTPSTTTPTPTPTTSSPSPTPTTTSSGPCPVAGKNVPGGADPWGGCFPGPGNTGVPVGTVLSDYTGPCNITAANAVIDSKRVTCSVLQISVAGVVIRNSYMDGTAVRTNGGSVSVVDSKIRGGARSDECCLSDRNYTALRVEFVGSFRGALCTTSCVVKDSWTHGQVPVNPNETRQNQGQHLSGFRQGDFGVWEHNTIACDWLDPNDYTTLGCSDNIAGYPNDLGIVTVHDNTYNKNLFISTTRHIVPNPAGPGKTTPYCIYAGGAGSTNQVITNNVFQRGEKLNGLAGCGDYGPVERFLAGGAGNVWSGNVYDDGTAVTPTY